ncbi:MAG: glucose 1-dehydrogenase [Steroidobacteraceae bacterium]
MRALTVQPGRAGSARLDELPEPPVEEGAVLVRTLAVGVCGTDAEIVSGRYGWAPHGKERLIIGHESLGIVESAPAASGLEVGDLVVGIVRHPDPVPCTSCAAGEWDMCRNGLYTEHGIKELSGFCADRFRMEREFLVRLTPALASVGVLLEPTSILVKAWDHIERIGSRAHWKPVRVLVTGAGPIGLLAALLAARRGLEVHVFDRERDGPKPALVRALGAHYHVGALADVLAGAPPDIVLECTGVPRIVLDVVSGSARAAVVCLVGVSAAGRRIVVDAGELNREIVLENDAVFGSVNANRAHYEAAARILAGGDGAWLGALISRRVPLASWAKAFERQPHDIKVVIDFAP